MVDGGRKLLSRTLGKSIIEKQDLSREISRLLVLNFLVGRWSLSVRLTTTALGVNF